MSTNAYAGPAQMPAPPAQPQPGAPMTADRQAKREGLFRPEHPNELLGSVLHDMLWQGRQVSDQERTRWEANRKMFRGEQYLSVSKTGVRTLAPTDKLPNGVRRVTINRIRPFVEARVSMFTLSLIHI